MMWSIQIQWVIFLNIGRLLLTRGLKACNSLRAIYLIKKPKLNNLCSTEELCNDSITNDELIVENYFGCEKTLWKILVNKNLCNEERYVTIITMCWSLKKIHSTLFPIRSGGVDEYKSYQERLNKNGIQVEERIRKQQIYQASRRVRLNEDHEFILRKTSVMSNSWSCLQDFDLDSSQRSYSWPIRNIGEDCNCTDQDELGRGEENKKRGWRNKT